MRSRGAEKFLWPVTRFWAFTPWGWACAVVWNICELLHFPVPFAPHVFGVIMGRTPHKVKDE